MISKVTDGLRKTRTFLDDVRGELRKSSWPARQELVESTLVVVVTVVMLSVYVGVCDGVLVSITKLLFR